jgi:hypothetical protein
MNFIDDLKYIMWIAGDGYIAFNGGGKYDITT